MDGEEVIMRAASRRLFLFLSRFNFTYSVNMFRAARTGRGHGRRSITEVAFRFMDMNSVAPAAYPLERLEG
jgi:hypothetical protein